MTEFVKIPRYPAKAVREALTHSMELALSGVSRMRNRMMGRIFRDLRLFQTIVAAMKQDVVAGFSVFTDDTPVPVLAKGKTHTGR